MGLFLLFLAAPLLCSCDELFKKDEPTDEFAYLMTDGVSTNVTEGQIIKVMDGSEVLFEMEYPHSSKIEFRIRPEYTEKRNAPKIMYVGMFNKLEDILLPANPQWGDTADIIAHGGIVAKVTPGGAEEPMYLRIFISSADYTEGKVKVQCSKIKVEKPNFGALFEAQIKYNESIIIVDPGNNSPMSSKLNLFVLKNAFPELRLSSNFSGQKEAPKITYCGQFDNIEDIVPSGEWTTEVPIEKNGGYYAQLETEAAGKKTVRMLITDISENGDIKLEYQIMTEK